MGRTDSARRVLGIDLSLTATGVALVRGSGKLVRWRVVKTTPKDIFEVRQEIIISHILRYVRRSTPSLVLIEQLAFGSKKKDDRPAQVLGALRRELWLAHVPYDFAPIGSVKLMATGNGRADKKMMIDAAQQFDPAIKDDNVADAVHVARYGAFNYTDYQERMGF